MQALCNLQRCQTSAVYHYWAVQRKVNAVLQHAWHTSVQQTRRNPTATVPVAEITQSKGWERSTTERVGGGKPQSAHIAVRRPKIWNPENSSIFVIWSLMSICSFENFPFCEWGMSPPFLFLNYNPSSSTIRKKKRGAFHQKTKE